MATFVVLAKWTEKTFGFLKDAPAAAEEMKRVITAGGAQIKDWYMLMGQYDEICILEAPDAETVTKILIPMAAQYGVKTETLRGFSEAEALVLLGGIK